MRCQNTFFSRPQAHIPLNCGPPAAHPVDLQQLYSMPRRPEPVFSNRRIHTTGELLEGYGQPIPPSPQPGHGAECFDPTLAVSNLANLDFDQLRQHINLQGQRGGQQQQRRNNRGQQQQDRQHQPPGLLLNGPALCYAAASFHLVERVKVLGIFQTHLNII